MSRRDRALATGFALALIAAVVTVILVLHHEIGRPGSTPLSKRALSLCYPNRGTAGC
jgi:hypothetical protein